MKRLLDSYTIIYKWDLCTSNFELLLHLITKLLYFQCEQSFLSLCLLNFDNVVLSNGQSQILRAEMDLADPYSLSF